MRAFQLQLTSAAGTVNRTGVTLTVTQEVDEAKPTPTSQQFLE